MSFVRNNAANFITLGNLLCGILGCIEAVQWRFETAYFFLLAGAVLDVFDGMVARALKSKSVIGKDLDSLADVVTFGVLPGLAMLGAMQFYQPGFFQWIALSLPLAAAWRLAVFNNDNEQSTSFRGLPTPAMGIAAAGLAALTLPLPDWVRPVVCLVLSMLMLSRLPMPSLKREKGKSFLSIQILPILLGVALGGVGAYWQGMAGASLGIWGYILGAVSLFLLNPRSRRVQSR
jgi:CDP-diacylglycerol--serine O-phosphatidyltransferase